MYFVPGYTNFALGTWNTEWMLHVTRKLHNMYQGTYGCTRVVPGTAVLLMYYVLRTTHYTYVCNVYTCTCTCTTCAHCMKVRVHHSLVQKISTLTSDMYSTRHTATTSTSTTSCDMYYSYSTRSIYVTCDHINLFVENTTSYLATSGYL